MNKTSISAITTIKDGTITLPREIQSSWKGAEVYIRVSDDTAILKKVYNPGKIFNDEAVKKLKMVGKKITDRDIENAIKWTRRSKTNS